ncbi:MAG: hypothetical protein ACOH1V_02405 [Stenotrophomonas sp.]
MTYCIATDAPATAPLPLRALYCLLFAAARDHRRANLLRQRSNGEHFRNQKRRTRRLSVASRLVEAHSRDTTAEARA